MDENRLPELPQESFRPMIAQSVQLEQFLGEELIFCFRDLDGVHTFTTCYGDIYKTVNALRDYVRLLESVCDQWELTGFHRATYEYHAEKLRKIADKLQAGIGYDYDKAVERCKRKRAQKSHSSDVGEDALLLTVRAADKSTDNEKEAAPYEEDTPWEPNSNNHIKTPVKKYHASVTRQSPRERNRLLACKNFAFTLPMCISTAATSGADSRPEATHGGCLWNEMNYAPL